MPCHIKHSVLCTPQVCKAIVHRHVVCTYSYDITPVVAQPVLTSPNLQVEQASVPLEWKLYLVQVGQYGRQYTLYRHFFVRKSKREQSTTAWL